MKPYISSEQHPLEKNGRDPEPHLPRNVGVLKLDIVCRQVARGRQNGEMGPVAGRF